VRVLSSGAYRTELEVALDVATVGHVIDAALLQSPVRDLAVEDAPLEIVIRTLYAEADGRRAET
jgi:ABC-type uncharacterized transport system ATPase subunit